MVAVDTNILVYAHRRRERRHAAAHERLTGLAEGYARWGIPVVCLAEFLRVVTHPRVVDPLTADEACESLRRILASPSLEVLTPGPRFRELFLAAVQEGNAIGNLAFDAQIVALCREAGVQTLITEDRDFHRFGGVTVEHLGARGEGPRKQRER